jgi:hypothetical protein
MRRKKFVLTVRVQNRIASWDSAEWQWKSENPEFEKQINDMIPAQAFEVAAPFLIGGPAGLALQSLQEFFGPALEIVAQTEWIPPQEEPGVVFAVPATRKERR